MATSGPSVDSASFKRRLVYGVLLGRRPGGACKYAQMVQLLDRPGRGGMLERGGRGVA